MCMTFQSHFFGNLTIPFYRCPPIYPDSPHESKARRRLSVVSDNHLIEGFADLKAGHPSGDGEPSKDDMGVRQHGAGRTGVGMGELRYRRSCILGYPSGEIYHDAGEEHDSDDAEEEEVIPCIVAR